ncbi:HlyC/CorC family transporter [Halomicrobium sp. IBSBa]|uniref:hemolysin family protein n=1 Tax=Halomicrobium sp. IBSBa TaxID=2778916 RepID=UPI001ABF2507|nr:hemolysin family protein [Halomicrobium sp. IBSBa]MBO4247725.1 HlyC/CorC family transporter [Halomicrobium sp. IBSBa]
MTDIALSLGGIALALFLVLLNGFFVASEFAFVRIRATSVEQLVEEGAAGAGVLDDVMDHLDDYLATTQLGITVASLGLGWVGEPAIADLLEPVLAPILPPSLLHAVAFAVGFTVITFLHVVFGELAPKTLAIADAEKISLLVAAPMKFFFYLFYPGIVVFNGTANYFTQLIGVEPASESEETLEEEEILRVLNRSGQAGHVDASEVEMIQRVFEFDDRSVREVMVPRPDVISVPAAMPVAELRSVVLDAGHTRYPVVDEDDDVVGFVDAKDVLRVIETGDESSATAGDIARDLPLVPESTRIDELLGEFQDQQRQMAVVIDEWGAFEGIATVEDVLETLVGDIRDNFDTDERELSIEHRDDGSYRVGGSVPLSAVNQELDSDFQSDAFETIGGLVLDRLGRAPEADDEIEADGYRISVLRVDGARIAAVELWPSQSAE